MNVDWPSLVAQLPLAAMTRELATRSQLLAADGDHYQLRVPVKALADTSLVDRLKAALAEFLGRPVRLTVTVGAVDGPTAAARAEQERDELQSRAEASIYNDPFVKQLIDNFGAKVDPQSIRPIQSKD
jgi:DNA polymerase-3 subunit gamma/tau